MYGVIAVGVQVPLVTVKPSELLSVPSTVTETFTDPAEIPGTIAVIDVFDHEVTEATVPPKLTVPDPWEEPKPDPLIVTDDPAAPEVGLMEEMVGEEVTPLVERTMPYSVYAVTVTVKLLPSPPMVLC
jgi:hypothetical protein